MFNKRLFLTKRRRRSNRFLNLKTLVESLNPVSGLSINRRFSSNADKLMRVRLGSDNSELDIGFKNNVLDTQSLIDFGGYNLLGYTEDLSNSSWGVSSNVSITHNKPDFEGGNNASQLDFSGTGVFTQTINIASDTYDQSKIISSIYIKGIAGETIKIETRASSDYVKQTSLTLNGSWQRIDNASANTADLGTTSSNTVFNLRRDPPNTVTSCLIYQPQVEISSTGSPTEYQPRLQGGASDCFVTTWYDQIGSNHATQTVATNQPKIYDVLTRDVTRENGKPAMLFDGTDDNLSIPNSQSLFTGLHKHNEFAELFGLFAPDTVQNTANAHVFSNITGSASTGYATIYRFSGNPFLRSIIFRGAGGTNSIVTNDFTPNDGLQKLYNAIVGDTFSEKTNNVNAVTNSSYNDQRSSSNATFDFRIGANGVNGDNYSGTIQELIIFNKNLTSEENNTLHNDINDHYSIF